MKKQYKMIEDFEVSFLKYQLTDQYHDRTLPNRSRASTHKKGPFQNIETFCNSVKNLVIIPGGRQRYSKIDFSTIMNLRFYYKGKLISYRSLPIDNEVMYFLDNLLRFNKPKEV